MEITIDEPKKKYETTSIKVQQQHDNAVSAV
jgi:hypothetical protein